MVGPSADAVEPLVVAQVGPADEVEHVTPVRVAERLGAADKLSGHINDVAATLYSTMPADPAAPALLPGGIEHATGSFDAGLLARVGFMAMLAIVAVVLKLLVCDE